MCQGYTCQRALPSLHVVDMKELFVELCVLIIGCSHPIYLWSPMGDLGKLLRPPPTSSPQFSSTRASASLTETLQPNSTDPPHSPHIAPGTRLVWWSATHCPPPFLYTLTKHSAPFWHEPDCFSLCPIHHCHSHCASYCFQFTPLGPHFQYPPSAQTTHSHSPWHCLHSTVCSPGTHSIGYFHFSLPFPVHLHCPSSTHSHTQPFIFSPLTPFHLSTFCCSSPLLCLWVPASLTSDYLHGPSHQIATWAPGSRSKKSTWSGKTWPPLPIPLKGDLWWARNPRNIFLSGGGWKVSFFNFIEV